MLSRKQKWRRCMSYVAITKKNYNDCTIPEQKKKVNLNFTAKKNTYNKLEESDSDNEDNIFCDKRHVNFKNVVNVILIPQRIEFKEVNLSDSLWYKDTDYLDFRISYSEELKKKYNSI